MDFAVKVETIGVAVPEQLFITNFEDNFDFDKLYEKSQVVKNEQRIDHGSDVLCKIFRYLPQRLKLYLIVLYIISKIESPIVQDDEDKPLR